MNEKKEKKKIPLNQGNFIKLSTLKKKLLAVLKNIKKINP
jgi:hypothetical protein